MTGRKTLEKEIARAQLLEPMPDCHVTVNKEPGLLCFNFLIWGGKPSTESTVRDASMTAGHVQETFLTHSQGDEKTGCYRLRGIRWGLLRDKEGKAKLCGPLIILPKEIPSR